MMWRIILTRDQINECIPVLSSIFVGWKWIVVWIITMCVTFAGVSFQSGRVIQSQNERIKKNENSFQEIKYQINDMEIKIDSILDILRG
jgi:hypothetical protein